MQTIISKTSVDIKGCSKVFGSDSGTDNIAKHYKSKHKEIALKKQDGNASSAIVRYSAVLQPSFPQTTLPYNLPKMFLSTTVRLASAMQILLII